MATVEAALKSPSVPLFSKGEVSLQDYNPSLEKHALSEVEGEGEISGRNEGELFANFWEWRLD